MFEPSRSDMLAKLLPVSDHVTDLSLSSHPPRSPARPMLQPLMTIEEFLEKRPDLPESGQWTELRDGAPVSFDPPGVDHGTVILNLSKLLSEYVHQSDQGYAAFDVGVVLQRSPDFVVFPSVSYFLEGPRFAESDNAVATRPPLSSSKFSPRRTGNGNLPRVPAATWRPEFHSSGESSPPTRRSTF